METTPTTTSTIITIEDIIDTALREAVAGKVTDELKLLQKFPYRTNVNWSLFPLHFRPSDPEEFGCHEG